MNRSIDIVNRQRAVGIHPRRIRPILDALLAEFWSEANIELGVCLVDTAEITRLNETFVRHRGPTDVITFDYSEPSPGHKSQDRALRGEIFICVQEALTQARRFRTTWQSELIRYLVHGVLHLSGYDDQEPAAHRRMKRVEDFWVQRLAARFDFKQLCLGRNKPT